MFQSVPADVVETLLLAACPEREAELRANWEQFQPEYQLRKDDVGTALSALGHRVRWMHKTFALDWAIATLGMHALTAYSPHILVAQAFGVPLSLHGLTDDADLEAIESHMDAVVYFAGQIRNAKRFEDVAWPDDIPPPGSCPDPAQDPAGKATFDLACLATAASFFHELRHVQFFAEQDAPALSVAEERACDEHARRMLLDRVADYALSRAESQVGVLNKRIMGLATAALCIAYAEVPGLSSAIANSHPPIAERFQVLVLESTADDDAHCWVYAACLIMHLLRRVNRMPPSVTFTSPKHLCTQLVSLL